MKVTVCFDEVKVIVPCGGSSIPNSNSSFLNSSSFKMIDATTSETETTGSSISTSSTCSSINSILKLEKDGIPASSSSTTGFHLNNNCQIRVSAVIESSIARFKKATGKVSNYNLVYSLYSSLERSYEYLKYQSTQIPHNSG